MFLNRDQVIAMDFSRSIGFEPVQAIILTSHNRNLRYGVASVLAISNGKRYNVRVGIDIKTFTPKLISVHELTLVFDSRRDDCTIKDVQRRLINANS